MNTFPVSKPNFAHFVVNPFTWPLLVPTECAQSFNFVPHDPQAHLPLIRNQKWSYVVVVQVVSRPTSFIGDFVMLILVQPHTPGR